MSLESMLIDFAHPVLAALGTYFVLKLRSMTRSLDRIDTAVNHQPAEEPTLVDRVKRLEADVASVAVNVDRILDHITRP